MNPDPTPSHSSDDTGPGGYGITWGVRGSFIAYIQGLGDGSIRFSDGANFDSNGAIHFPFAALSAGERNNERWIRCSGGVLFQGHFGMLSVPLLNLAIRVTEDGATLCAEQESGSYFPIGEVDLANPEVSDAGVLWRDAAVTLNEPGSRFFGSNYSEGTVMDPLCIRVPPFQ
ncbi:hypothetical protein J2X01_002571 [Arthrobacter ginsengisoli]|uniref:Htaa domain-containing protein n=1 Tax=Arthrobacter ginsengisoli TaxID=1356565 RepID=A0ABU1UDJ4_9MICC|nr:HtaA domain-containing protein [Arthrobacter ginsengisoli]MDR7083277.1 hypothetical protein [Arthrobacter ginsengisoli]